MNALCAPLPPRSALLTDLGKDLEELFLRALAERVFSAASLAVASPGGMFLARCWGTTHEGGRPVHEQTRFDLASLTKPLVTASLCMWAVGNGRLDLESRLGEFFPKGSVPSSKSDISVRQLLNHSSGFLPYVSYYTSLVQVEPAQRRETLLTSILESPLIDRPGTVCRYSDLGFLLLGILIEDLLGASLDDLASSILSDSIFTRELQYCRLPMNTNPILPPIKSSEEELEFAVTELCPWRMRLLVGEVHDENAFCLGGVAGHAGLFGTATGIVRWLTFLWRLYRNESWSASWSPEIVREFWDRPRSAPVGTWVLGFDTPSPSASSAGRFFSPHSVGHLGFTGTSFWLDLEKDILIVLLTNRVYPSRKNDRIKAFRPLVHDLVMKGIHAI